jgi:hypothetical protein
MLTETNKMVFHVNDTVYYLPNGDLYKWSAVVNAVNTNGSYEIQFDGIETPSWAGTHGIPGPFNSSRATAHHLLPRVPAPDDQAKRSAWNKRVAAWRAYKMGEYIMAKAAGFGVGRPVSTMIRVLPDEPPVAVEGTVSSYNPETFFFEIKMDGGATTVGMVNADLVAAMRALQTYDQIQPGLKVSWQHMDSGPTRAFDKKLKGTVVSINPTTNDCRIRSETYGVTSYTTVHASLVSGPR